MDLLVLEVVGTLLLHGINLVLVSFGKTFCDLQTLLHTFFYFLLIFNFLPLQRGWDLDPNRCHYSINKAKTGVKLQSSLFHVFFVH